MHLSLIERKTLWQENLRQYGQLHFVPLSMVIILLDGTVHNRPKGKGCIIRGWNNNRGEVDWSTPRRKSFRAVPSSGKPQRPGRYVSLDVTLRLTHMYILTVNKSSEFADWCFPQVPTLTSATLSTPLTNTLEITYLIGNRYPSLIPPPHRSTIEDLLGKLHAIQPLSLSIPPPENRSEGIPNPIIGQYLSQPGISDAWRNALIYKEDLWVVCPKWLIS